jgi:hypothetical protein
MDKRQIESYLKKKGMNPKDRVQKNGGGQYLDNFLKILLSSNNLFDRLF